MNPSPEMVRLETLAESHRISPAEAADVRWAIGRIAALEEGLKPFAGFAAEQDAHLTRMGINMPDYETVSYCPRIGDLRRARSLTEEGKAHV